MSLLVRMALGWCCAPLVLCVLAAHLASGQTIELPEGDATHPIIVSGEKALRWQEGVFEVVLLDGPCVVEQGMKRLEADRAVLWIQPSPVFELHPHRVTVYLEGAELQQAPAGQSNAPSRSAPPTRIQAKQWQEHLASTAPVEYRLRLIELEPSPRPPLYQRALLAKEPHHRRPGVSLAQFIEPIQGPTAQLPPPELAGPSPNLAIPGTPPAMVTVTIPEPTTPSAGRRVQILPRSSAPANFASFPSEDGREQIAVIDSGVNIVIDGVPTLGTIDIATDRLVAWGPPDFDVTGGGGSAPIEFYMEGNIVFRQADRVIYANSMYYNVARELGVVLDAELLTQLPDCRGVVRLKADVLRQMDRFRFQAFDTTVTTSRLGVPSYWFQSEALSFEDVPSTQIDPLTGQVEIDPATGQPRRQRLAQSRNNAVYFGGFPVFYWPQASSDLTQPTNYIRRVRFSGDRVFGTQIGVGLAMDQILGWSQRYPGVEWTLNLDYLSDRGFGVGSTVDYEFSEFLGVQGPTQGFLDAWGIRDDGLDNLGLDRRALVPEKDLRGRALWQHRQRTLGGLQISAEVGYISDRNFLEQYYEREWDQWKDQSTRLEFKRLFGSHSWNLAVQGQLNDFFTETQWLPRLDHFALGESLFGNRLTWFGHSQVGYADLEPATAPLDPTDAAKFNPLAWEADVEGIRIGGRHELDLPFQVRGVKVVPYVLGEAMHWGEDLTGDDVTRLFGQVGVRASMPMWTVDPTVKNELFNLNGLAHKVVWESELFWADASEELGRFPLYDPLDDNATEHFRRRYVDDIFGGMLNVADTIPLRFDERYFALRSGMQSWVTAPSAEIADDLALFRVGVRQRWQTKRGAPGRQRIVDWMTLDLGGTIYPDEDRDNFGEVVGMLNYDWRWHLGDRLTITSDGYADTFADGLRTISLGGYINRPERSSFYLGLRSIEGPLSSNIISTAFNYRMSHKWVGSAGLVYDFGPTGSIGQIAELTRIGESFLVTVGARVDESRDNVGVSFSVEPRIFPFSYRGLVGGKRIPPTGAYGLE